MNNPKLSIIDNQLKRAAENAVHQYFYGSYESVESSRRVIKAMLLDAYANNCAELGGDCTILRGALVLFSAGKGCYSPWALDRVVADLAVLDAAQ